MTPKPRFLSTGGYNNRKVEFVEVAFAICSSKKAEPIHAALAACNNEKIDPINAALAACFARITNPVVEEDVKITCRKNGNCTKAEQAKSSETSCMNVVDQRRKLQKMCPTYRLCATPLHAPPTQHLLPKRFTASAPLCLPKL